MKFYLRTLSPAEFMEVNQAVSLSGVYTEPFDFTRKDVPVNETLKGLLEVMAEEQSVFVYGISNGFRNILEEGRRLQKFSAQLVLTIPVDVQGLMAAKAAVRMKVPVACGRIFDLEQAAAAMHNQAGRIVLNLENISRYASAKKVLKRVLKLARQEGYDCERILVVCSSAEQMRMAIAAGAVSLAADKDVYDGMMYSILTSSETAACRDEWILTYTRAEVLDQGEQL